MRVGGRPGRCVALIGGGVSISHLGARSPAYLIGPPVPHRPPGYLFHLVGLVSCPSQVWQHLSCYHCSCDTNFLRIRYDFSLFINIFWISLFFRQCFCLLTCYVGFPLLGLHFMLLSEQLLLIEVSCVWTLYVCFVRYISLNVC